MKLSHCFLCLALFAWMCASPVAAQPELSAQLGTGAGYDSNAYLEAGEQFPEGLWDQVMDALGAIEDEQAVLQLGDETAPCLLMSEFDRGFTHVIMPMRL